MAIGRTVRKYGSINETKKKVEPKMTTKQAFNLATALMPVVTGIINIPDVTKEMKEVVNKFMGKGYKVGASWNSLIPVATKCFNETIKRKIKDESDTLQGIKKLEPTNRLKDMLALSVQQNKPELLLFGLHQRIKWLNDNTTKK